MMAFIEQVLSPFFLENWIVIVLFSFSFLADVFLRRYRARVKKEVYSKHEQEVEITSEGGIKRKNAEFYLEYYKKSQIIDTIRIGLIIITIFVLIIIKTNAAINVLTVGIGVIILIFKEVILSFAAFFYVISRYKIGDIIRFGSINGMDCLGEIIYVHPLYVRLIAKDQSGNHTGRVIHIPNYKFFTDINQKLDLSSQSYRRIDLDILYNSSRFEVSFQEFMQKLEHFLDDHLSAKTSKMAENFKSYFGLKYKIHLSYEGDNIRVGISYIQQASNTTMSKKNIIYFVEGLRHKHRPHCEGHHHGEDSIQKHSEDSAQSSPSISHS